MPARPGQFLTVRLHPDPEPAPLLRTYSLSGAPGRGELPDQRQTRSRTARRASYLHTAAPRRRRHRGGRAARLLRAAPGRSPRRADQRRGRGDAGAGDAARARRRALGAAGVVAARRSQSRRARLRARRRSACSPSSRDAHRIVCYSHPGPTRPGASTSPDGSPARCSSRPAFRPTPTSTSAARRRSCTTSPPPLSRAGWHPSGSAPRCSDRPTRSRPASPTRPARSPHPPAGAPGAGPIDLVRPQQPVGRVGSVLREPARARGGLRRPGAVVVPDGRLPHVRDRARQRRGQLPARPARTASAGHRPDLLFPARR